MKNFRQVIIDMDTRIPNNVVVAYKQGKVIECRSTLTMGSDWIPQSHVDTDGFMPDNFEYRVKSEPTLRPWKPEEVPVGALIKVKELKYLDGLHVQMLIYICPQGVTLSARNGIMECKLPELLSIYEHSLDHGKTWQPCGVLE